MTQPIGFGSIPAPVAAPLLPNEIANIEANGWDPSDFMAMWIPPMPDGQGHSFAGTQDGQILGVRAAGFFATAALASTKPSGLVVVAQSGESLEVLTVGIRMIVKRSGMRLDPIHAGDWHVVMREHDQAQEILEAAKLDSRVDADAEGDQIRFTVCTVYEAQTISARLIKAAAGLDTMVDVTIDAVLGQMTDASQTEPDAPVLRLVETEDRLSVLDRLKF